MPDRRDRVDILDVEQQVGETLVEHSRFDTAEALGRGEHLDLHDPKLAVRPRHDDEGQPRVQPAEHQGQANHGDQHSAHRNACRLEGSDLVVAVHPPKCEKDAEEVAHRDRQYDDVRNRQREKAKRLVEGHATDKDLLHEGEDRAHEQEERVGSETERCRSQNLPHDEAVENAANRQPQTTTSHDERFRADITAEVYTRGSPIPVARNARRGRGRELGCEEQRRARASAQGISTATGGEIRPSTGFPQGLRPSTAVAADSMSDKIYYVNLQPKKTVPEAAAGSSAHYLSIFTTVRTLLGNDRLSRHRVNRLGGDCVTSTRRRHRSRREVPATSPRVRQ